MHILSIIERYQFHDPPTVDTAMVLVDTEILSCLNCQISQFVDIIDKLWSQNSIGEKSFKQHD